MDIDGVPQPNLPNDNNKPTLPTGHVGKLRIHKSGKATLDWGGTPLLLGMGADATFLQNVLIASVPEKKPVIAAGDDGSKEKGKRKEGEEEQMDPAVGMGMGQVRGKFVVTPDWDEILR
jgi:DNA-directed RNA polymerase III subunit RPC4